MFVLDNTKYHRCEEGDPRNQGPNRASLSQLNKDALIQRLVRRGCPETAEELKKKLKPVLYEMAQEDQYQNKFAVEVAAEAVGYEIFWLPPYHPELNPIEEAWGLTKQHVALENDGSHFKKVKDLYWMDLKWQTRPGPNLFVEPNKTRRNTGVLFWLNKLLMHWNQ